MDGSRTGLEPIAKRVSIQRKTDLRFPNFEGLVTGVSSNLSTSGMFIQSDKPEPAGTEFGFALRIEEWSPIQGEAKVIWTRSKAEGPERPAGMGVQFVNVDAQSRRMIRWLVDKHLQEGGTPFDLETVPAGVSMYGGHAESLESRTKRGKGRRRRSSRGSAGSKSKLLIGMIVLLVLLAAAYGSYLKWFQAGPGTGESQITSSGTPGNAVPAEEGTTSGDTDTPIRADVTAIENVTLDEVASFIQSWIEAWEALDADGLIAHYAENFDASAHGGRQQWETDIRRQVEDAEHIRIAVSAMDISFPTADSARAEFFRSFRSNSSNSSGRFVLDLTSTDGSWKILSEQALD